MTDKVEQDMWFLAQVKPNSAAIAHRNLNRQGFETFMPVETVTRPRNGRFVTALQPMFPGYIFVAVDQARGLWRKVNSTYGVTRLVSFGAEPAPVPRAFVQDLMAQCDDDGKLEPAPQLAPGDQVRVATGPFASMIAEIESLAPDQRVWVLMDVMGSKTRVAVKKAQLRPA